jgi:hypothetical protein
MEITADKAATGKVARVEKAAVEIGRFKNTMPERDVLKTVCFIAFRRTYTLNAYSCGSFIRLPLANKSVNTSLLPGDSAAYGFLVLASLLMSAPAESWILIRFLTISSDPHQSIGKFCANM